MDLLRLDLNKRTPDLPTVGELRFQVAFLAAVSVLLGSFIARFVFGAPLVPELLAQFVFAVAPMWAVEVAVGMLGAFAKHLAFVGCSVLYLLALISVGVAYLGYLRVSGSALARRIWPFAFSLLVWAATVLLVLPLLGDGVFGNHLQQGAVFTSISLLAVHAIYGATLFLATAQYIERPMTPGAPGKIISRRRVVRGIGYAVLAVGIYTSRVRFWARGLAQGRAA